jgi:hypothetical protein
MKGDDEFEFEEMKGDGRRILVLWFLVFETWGVRRGRVGGPGRAGARLCGEG